MGNRCWFNQEIKHSRSGNSTVLSLKMGNKDYIFRGGYHYRKCGIEFFIILTEYAAIKYAALALFLLSNEV